MTDLRAWDETRYPVWRRRILAVKDSQTIRMIDGRPVVTKICTESRRLSAVMRAWGRACRRLND
jgi:hypothetical protein